MSVLLSELRRVRGRAAAALAAGIAALLVVLAICAGHRGPSAGDGPLATVQRGELPIDLTSVGEVQALRSLSYGVPRLKTSAVKLVWLVPEGSSVVPGDTLARFDATEVTRRIEDLESRLVSARANLEKLRASQGARRSDMEAGLQDQRASLRLAEINASNVEYEARVEQEKAALALQRAQLAVGQAEAKVVAQRSIDAAELTEQQVSIGSLESQLQSEREAADNHSLVATAAGMVVYGSNWSGGRQSKIKLGDQMYYGGVVLELPDLSQLRVTSSVNEARVDRLRVGQRCDLRIDAFPDTLYHGAVTRINVLGRELPESDGVKVFDFEVLLDGADARLRPGMTATVTAHVDKLHDVVFAPIETVHADSAGATYVWRRVARHLERVPVTVGRQNDFHVELRSGVAPGDRLALRAPAKEAGGE